MTMIYNNHTLNWGLAELNASVTPTLRLPVNTDMVITGRNPDYLPPEQQQVRKKHRPQREPLSNDDRMSAALRCVGVHIKDGMSLQEAINTASLHNGVSDIDLRDEFFIRMKDHLDKLIKKLYDNEVDRALERMLK